MKISVVIPALNERDGIKPVLEDLEKALPGAEIIVVDNGSRDGTGDAARKAGARVIREEERGYGRAILAGLKAARGNRIGVIEADFTFRATDLARLLGELKAAEFTIGTRTSAEMLGRGCALAGPARIANILLGAVISSSFKSKTKFTDAGCTLRAVRRDSLSRIIGRLKSPGPEFSPEMMCEAAQAGLETREIPVEYHPRTGGKSKHGGNYFRLAATSLRMMRTIARKRLYG
jgi:glycosyltransferase involved in cell wall biosynthesis